MKSSLTKTSKFSKVLKITEAITVLGIIVSIVSLTIQIRQNTKAVQAASYQDVASGMSGFMSTLAQNADLAEIYLIGCRDPSALPERDRVRFEMLLGSLFAECDMAVDLQSRRMIDDKMMMPYTKYFSTIMQSPGVAEWWKNSQGFFSNDMGGFINNLPSP